MIINAQKPQYNWRVLCLLLVCLFHLGACTTLPPEVLAELRPPAAQERDAFALRPGVLASQPAVQAQAFSGTALANAQGQPIASLAALPAKPVRLITSGGANADD